MIHASTSPSTTAGRPRRRWFRPTLAVASMLTATALAAATPAAASAPDAVSAQGSHTSRLDPTRPPTVQAYSLLTATGRVVGYGGAFSGVTPAPTSPVVGVASTSDGHGAYAAEADGGVITLGDAAFHGSMSAVPLVKPIVGIAVDPLTGGYWLVASDGGIFAFGGAPFFGSTGAIHLAKPIVGISATPTGRGYRMVASDGGIFAFGDARFYGSTGGIHLTRPVISMSATTSGHGYWMVASDGGIFTFGDAAFYGSGTNLGAPVVGMATGDSGNYDDPLRDVTGLIPMRVDEGVDYGGSGPVYALGDGVVESTTGNWPGGAFISYILTDGPAVGKMVYVAENLTPTVQVGQTVTANTVIGILHDAYPDMETGWAHDGYGDTMAAASGAWTPADDSGSVPSAYGVNFNQLLVSLGAPSGVLEHPSMAGSLAAGWPTW